MTGRNAFLQRHQTMMLAIQRLQALADADRAATAEGCTSARLNQAIVDFNQHLLEHFASEERGGYMAGLLKEHPHLTRRVGSLAQDHEQLRSQAMTLMQQGSETHPSRSIVDLVEAFLAALQSHEQRETQLLQDAWCTDQGAAG